MTALCGPSGSGKSTVAALLVRFYDPAAGAVTLDGVQLSELAAAPLRDEVIGYIGQEPVLFAGSISENIRCGAPNIGRSPRIGRSARWRRYGRPGASEAEVRAAASAANADEFIQALPAGYQTVVGERGAQVLGNKPSRPPGVKPRVRTGQTAVSDRSLKARISDALAPLPPTPHHAPLRRAPQLSGGQKQRVAIARALLKKPEVCPHPLLAGSPPSKPPHPHGASLEGRQTRT
eukprot:SAG11_NODE_983_length_6306_cov_19.831319_3_plen_234_part_00